MFSVKAIMENSMVKIYKKKGVKPVTWFCLFWVVAACAGVVFSGCSRVPVVKKLPLVEKDNLRKKIALIHLETASENSTDYFENLFRQYFDESMKRESAGNQVITRNNALFPDQFKNIDIRSIEWMDNFSMALIGRQAGLNAIAMANLIAIIPESRVKGLLWFKKERNIVRVHVRVIAYHTATAAKLVDANLIRELIVDEFEYDSIRAGEIDAVSELESVLSSLADEAAETICSEVENQPWNTYITSVEEGLVVIAAGENAGVKKGDRFSVYGRGKIVKGVGEKQFLMPGQKSGRIEVTSVSPNESRAMVLINAGIRFGDEVREE
jgi:hypothetical protein